MRGFQRLLRGVSEHKPFRPPSPAGAAAGSVRGKHAKEMPLGNKSSQNPLWRNPPETANPFGRGGNLPVKAIRRMRHRAHCASVPPSPSAGIRGARPRRVKHAATSPIQCLAFAQCKNRDPRKFRPPSPLSGNRTHPLSGFGRAPGGNPVAREGLRGQVQSRQGRAERERRGSRVNPLVRTPSKLRLVSCEAGGELFSSFAGLALTSRTVQAILQRLRFAQEGSMRRIRGRRRALNETNDTN